MTRSPTSTEWVLSQHKSWNILCQAAIKLDYSFSAAAEAAQPRMGRQPCGADGFSVGFSKKKHIIEPSATLPAPFLNLETSMKLSVPMMQSATCAVAVSLLCAGGTVAQQNDMSRIAKEVVQGHTQSAAKSPASNADVVSNGNGSNLSSGGQNSYDEQIKKAQEYLKQGNFDLALQEYDKIIAVNPNIASLYITRGDIYVAKSNFEQAIQEYSKAIVLDQNNHHNQEGKGNQDYYERRGMIYFTVGDLEHALQDYNKMIAMNPNNGNAYYSRGMVHAMAMDYNQAMQDYKKACSLGHTGGCSMMKGK